MQLWKLSGMSVDEMIAHLKWFPCGGQVQLGGDDFQHLQVFCLKPPTERIGDGSVNDYDYFAITDSIKFVPENLREHVLQHRAEVKASRDAGVWEMYRM